MASLKDIRKRIVRVKSTQKITRAMKMVAGARLNKAQRRITELRPYAVKTQEVLSEVTTAGRRKVAEAEEHGVVDDDVHPLLQVTPEKSVYFFLVEEYQVVVKPADPGRLLRLLN